MSADGQLTKWLETLWKISIAWVGCLNVTDTRQTAVGRTMTYSECEREFTFAKNWEFFCLFVCLLCSGSWTWIKDWGTRGLLIQIVILSPFVSQFWCRFHHSLEEEMLLHTFQRHLIYAAVTACNLKHHHYCHRIRSKFFSENSKGRVCAHDFDHLGEG